MLAGCSVHTLQRGEIAVISTKAIPAKYVVIGDRVSADACDQDSPAIQESLEKALEQAPEADALAAARLSVGWMWAPFRDEMGVSGPQASPRPIRSAKLSQ